MIPGLFQVATALLLLFAALLSALVVALLVIRGTRPVRDRRRSERRARATDLLLRLVLGEDGEAAAARMELTVLSGAGGRELDRQALGFLTKLRGEPREVLRDVVVARGGLEHALRLCRSRWTVRRCRGAYRLGLLAVPEAAAPLVDLLADRKVTVRRLAIRALGVSGTPASVPALLAAGAEPQLRADVVAALVRLGRDAVPALREHVAAAAPRPGGRPSGRDGDGEAGSAAVAARALGLLGDVGAAGALVQAVSRGERELAAEAAFSLGEIGTPIAVPVLVDALDGPPDLRKEAATALGRIGDPAAADALAPMLHEDRQVSRAAAAALLRLGPGGEGVLRGSSSSYAAEALAVARLHAAGGRER